MGTRLQLGTRYSLTPFFTWQCCQWLGEEQSRLVNISDPRVLLLLCLHYFLFIFLREGGMSRLGEGRGGEGSGGKGREGETRVPLQ